jgi:glycosyltransferase involved in cell wall biosynthesis
MRVLHLISSAGLYGAESMLLNLTETLKELGCDAIVGVICNSQNPHTELSQCALDRGMEAAVFACRGRVDYKLVRELAKYCQVNHIDLLHTHGMKADVYGYAAHKASGVSVISTHHIHRDAWTPSPKMKLYYRADLFCLKRFDRVAAVSEPVRRSLCNHGVPDSIVRQISNGVNVKAFRGAAPSLANDLGLKSKLMIGYVGRLIRQKGIQNLLHSAKKLLGEFPDLVFIFVGDGPDRMLFEDMSRDLALGTSVVFAGKRCDMPGVYASFDVLALPSENEALPMTLIEALSAGKAVVATRVGGIPQLIHHEQTGLLVEPRDVNGLTNALRRLLKSSALRAALGARGQALVQAEYSSMSMAQQYLQLYTELLDSKTRSVKLGRMREELIGE